MSSTAVVLATGFAQPAKLSNGLRRIAVAIPAGVKCEVRSWREHEDIPDFAAQLSTYDRLVFAGHSWGCWYLNELAKALDGIVSVAAMLLADPVTRPPGGTLFIPPNVRSVAVWRKHSGLIPTAEIGWAAGDLEITWVDAAHHRVDECEEFRAAVIAAVTKEQ